MMNHIKKTGKKQTKEKKEEICEKITRKGNHIFFIFASLVPCKFSSKFQKVRLCLFSEIKSKFCCNKVKVVFCYSEAIQYLTKAKTVEIWLSLVCLMSSKAKTKILASFIPSKFSPRKVVESDFVQLVQSRSDDMKTKFISVRLMSRSNYQKVIHNVNKLSTN